MPQDRNDAILQMALEAGHVAVQIHEEPIVTVEEVGWFFKRYRERVEWVAVEDRDMYHLRWLESQGFLRRTGENDLDHLSLVPRDPAAQRKGYTVRVRQIVWVITGEGKRFLLQGGMKNR